MSASNSDSRTTIIVAVISAVAAIIVAFIGFYSSSHSSPREIPPKNTQGAVPDVVRNQATVEKTPVSAPESKITTVATAPTEKKVSQRSIDYEIDSCKREGSSALACYGTVTNTGSGTRRVVLLSEQHGGIRSTALDGLGKTKAIDDHANEYVAKQILLANQGSPETGQFFYDLRPGLQTPLIIRFSNFDASANTLYSLEIHGGDGSALDVVFKQIPVSRN